MKTGVLCSFVVLLSATILCAQTVTWDGGGDGVSWQDPLNWSGDAVPGPTNDVTINLAGASVRFDGADAAVRSLSCSRPFALVGGSLIASNGFNFSSATVDYQGGGFIGSVRLTSCALNIMPGATNAADFVALGSCSLSGVMAASQTIRVQGGGATGHGVLEFKPGAINRGLIRVETSDGGWTSKLTTSGVFTNDTTGEIRIRGGSGGPRSFEGELVNRGLIDATDYALPFYGTYDSAGGQVLGNCAFYNVNLRVSASRTTNVTLVLRSATTLLTDNLPNTTLWVQGGGAGGHATLTSTNGFTNSGTILLRTLDGGWGETFNVTTGKLVNAANGVLRVEPGSGGVRTMNASIENHGLIEVASGIGVHCNGANQTLRQEGALVANGAWTWADGFLDFASGSVEGTVWVVNGSLRIHDSVVSDSTVSVSGTTTLLANDSLSARVWVRGGGQYGHATLAAAPNAVNAGRVLLQTTDGGWNSVLTTTAAGFVNKPTGVIEAGDGSGGSRSCSGWLVNQGAVLSTNGLFLSLYGTYQADGGTLEGSLALIGGEVQVTHVAPATTTIPLRGSTTLTTDNLTNTTLWVQGGGNGLHGVLTAPGSFTNEGTIRLQSISGNYESDFVVSTGRLHNAASGVLEIKAGTGGGRYLTASLDNEGTLAVETGTSLYCSGEGRDWNQLGGLVNAAGLCTWADGRFNLFGGDVAGSLYVRNGTINVAATATSSNTVIAAANCTLEDNLSPTTTIRVEGGSRYNHATLTTQTNGSLNLGIIRLRTYDGGYASTLVADSGLTNGASGIISSEDGSGGVRTLAGTLINQGLVSAEPGYYLNLSGNIEEAGGRFEGSVRIRNSLLHVTAAPASPTTMLLWGANTLASDNLTNVTLQVQGGGDGHATLNWTNGWNNFGGVLLDSFNGGYSATLNVTGDALHNQAGGLLEVRPGSGGSRTINAELINEGDVLASTGVTLTTSGANHENGGTIRLANATLTFGGSALLNHPAGRLAGAGTFSIAGVDFLNAGRISPGASAGRLTFNSGFAQSDTAQLDIEIGGPTAGADFDQVVINGPAQLAGTVNITLTNGFVPEVGSVFPVVTYGSLTGGFRTFNGLAIDAERGFEPFYKTTQFELRTLASTNLGTNLPSILVQPASQTVERGSRVRFQVIANGSPPLNYQWRFDGTDLPGQTRDVLAFANAEPSLTGDYSAVVANSAGAVTSAVATLTVTVPSQVVYWDGGGDGTNWSDPFNWSGDFVPGATNDVIADVPGLVMIAVANNTTVGSLQSEEALLVSGGTFTVMSGPSWVNGGLTVNASKGLTAQGSNTTFTANGPTLVDGALLAAQDGARLILPMAYSFTSGRLTLSSGATAALAGLTNVNLSRFLLSSGATFALPTSVTGYSSSGGMGISEKRTVMSVQGPGTRLDVSSLQTFEAVFSGLGGLLQLIVATEGGEVDLSGVSSIRGGGSGANGGGPLEFRTDATGNIRLSAVAQLTGTGAGILVNYARSEVQLPQLAGASATQFPLPTGGKFSAPSLASLQSCRLTVPEGAHFNAPALTEFSNCTLSLSGAGVFQHGTLTTADRSRFLLSAGATYTLPESIRSFSSSDGFGISEQRTLLSATGAGTRLDFSSVTNMEGVFSGLGGLRLLVVANDGGLIDLSGLQILRGGGSGANGGGPFEFRSDATGKVLLSALTQATGTGAGVLINLAGTNTLSAGPLTLTNAELTLSTNSLASVGELQLGTGGELSGIGVLEGNVFNVGTVRPGSSAGQLTILGNYTQAPNGTIIAEVGGTNAGTQYDQLVVSGSAVLDGSLDMRLINSYAPDLSDTFQILTCTSRSGQFANLLGADAGKSVEFIPSYQTNGVLLSLRFAAGPSVTSTWPAGTITDTFNQFILTFSEALSSSSFTTADISLSGPAGTITVNAPQLLSNVTWRVTFASQTEPGDYTLTLGPAINDLVGNPMNQDGDLLNGEATDDQFVLTVTVPAPVDFVVAELIAPAVASVGTPMPLVWTVANAGTNPAAGPRTDAVYLSTDRTVGNDVLLGEFTTDASLGAGESRSTTNVVVLPVGTSGTRYFIVMADSSHGWFETTETNNTFVSTNATIVSAADLAVTSVSASKTSAQFSESLTVTWVVRNSGSATAGTTWRDRIYLSPTATLTAQSLALTTDGNGGPLGVGESYTNSATVTLPLQDNLSAGTYYLVVATDVSNAQAEANEANNLSSRSIALTIPPLPDLMATDVRSPSVALPGALVEITWAVTNGGSATATAGWTEAIYAAEAATNGPAVLLARFFATNDLAAGEGRGRTQTVSLPVTGLAGEVRFSVVADGDATVVESAETNNAAWSADTTFVPPALTVTLPMNSVPESAAQPTLTALLQRNGSLSNALPVTVVSSDTNKLIVPLSVTIPAGQASTPFPATVQWDHIPDADTAVTISASTAGFTNGVATLSVLNVDVPQLVLTPALGAVIEALTLPVVVSRNPATDQPLVVSLASQSPTDLITPVSVTIPAYSNSASFNLAAPQDTFIESPVVVSFTASAAGYISGVSAVTVVDDDFPTVLLALNPASVAENAGGGAVVGTVYRGSVTGRALTLQLETGDSNAVALPYLVTIPANEFSANFALEVVDDALMNGTRQVGIAAYVTESLSGARIGEPATNQLTILDDDGPTLSLTLTRTLLPEGSNTLATITRNTPATNDLVVTVTSSDTTEATVPATVTLRASTNAAPPFTIVFVRAVDDGTPDGTQTATLTASAAGFNSGVAVIQVTDINLPDVQLTEVSGPASGFTKAMASVSFRVANLGLAPLSNAIVQRVWLSDDPLAGNDTLVGEYTFNQSNESIAPGLSFQQTVSTFLPLQSGEYWVIVTTDAANAAVEIDEANNTRVSSVPIHVTAEYTATVQTEITTTLAGTVVPLTGQVTMANGQSPEGRLVSIHVVRGGFKRVIGAIAQADGTFALNFHPLPNEAGFYTIGAAHPGEAVAPVQDNFTLLGAKFEPTRLALTLAPGASIGGSATLRNLGDATLDGLAVSPVGVPANLNVTAMLATNVLPADGTVAVSYGIAVTAATPSPADFTLRVMSTEGVTVDLPVSVTIRPLQAELVAQPASLTAGMLVGGQKLVTFEVVNQGGATSAPVQLVLPQASWLTVASTNPLPPLAPGESNSVTLQLTPPANLPLTAYDGQLAVLGGASAVPVPFRFIALSEARGSLEVLVEDENTYYTASQPRVAGATVRLLDPFNRTVVAETLSDTNGTALFRDLTEGPYTLQVEAAQHDTYSSPITVEAGLTNSVRAFVAVQTVAYRWSVVPTEAEDRYRMSLETTFEANVPWPVVTVDQPLIVPLVFPGEVTQMEVTFTNHGLVAAQGLQLHVHDTATYKITPLIRDIGELPARSSITVPVLIQLQPDLDQQAVDAIRAHTGDGSPAPRSRSPRDGNWGFIDECEYPSMDAYYFVVCGADRRWHLVKVDIRALLGVKELAGCAKSIAGNAPNLLKSPFSSAMGMICDCLIPAAQKLAAWMGVSFNPKPMECICATISLNIEGMAKCVCYKGEIGMPEVPSDSGGGGGSVHINPVEFASGDCTPGIAVPLGSGPLATRGAGGGRGGRSDDSAGICAQVRLRLDQDLVLTRNAFRATLEIDNRTPDTSLTNVFVRLDFFDSSGANAGERFVITATNLTRLSGVDGSGVVWSNTTGAAEFTLLPTSDAAPQGNTPYLVGGELRYTLGSQQFVIPLTPAPITVLPDPSLTIRYFHQRDVFSDDPHSAEVEPAIPYALGMLVQNTGNGTARNVRITSGQPKIVDNEKGLLIDFELIASEVAGQNLTPSLTVNFGDIPPGTNAIAKWLFTSSLQGLFVDYSATFEHLDGLGNPRLSLVDAVEIHEMNHLVNALDGDSLPDFLVNDTPDDDDLPDVVYLSNSTVQPVAVVRSATPDGAPSTGDLEVALGVSMPSSGYGYLRVADPQGANGARQFRLVAVRRAGGTSLPPDNFWQTDRTFIGQGRQPIRENLLHLFDHASTGQYVLTYAPVAAADTTAPTSVVAALPSQSYPQILLAWSGQDDAGGSGLAGFDVWVSDNGGAFTRWLERTTLTSAFYPGVAGHVYAFYSTAVDSSGNVEPIPGAPDAQTTVSLINTPPTLSLGLDLIVDEGQTVFIASSATDTNAGQALTFSLLSAPANTSIHPATGLVTWPTGETDGPGTNTFTVRVTDNGLPQLSAAASVTVVVREVNQPPILAVVTNRTIKEGFTLLITNIATDLDLPPNQLSFSFGASAPPGATLNTTSGLFRWRPTETQGPSTNPVWIVVSDSGTPVASATQSFAIVVQDVLTDLTLSAGATNLLAGERIAVPLLLNSMLDVTNLSFELETDGLRLTNLTIEGAVPEVLSVQASELSLGRLAVSLQLDPASLGAASRRIASLGITALTNHGSAIVPVTLSHLQARRSGGEAVANTAANPGRVIIVEREPVLFLSGAPSPVLMVFGLPGRSYALLAATNLAVGADWREFHRLTLVGRSAELAGDTLPAAPNFFRAWEVAGDMPRLELLHLGGNLFGLRLTGEPGVAYTVQSVGDLTGGTNWSNVSVLMLTNAAGTLYWTNETDGQRFFRARKP